MKQTVKYRVITIPNKIFVEIRLVFENNIEYITMNEGNKYTNISMNPIIGLSMIKKDETDENGTRIKSVWNPNDHLGMTKYMLPIIYEELHGIQQDLKKPELYTYHGKRLELNETLAETIRRVFMIGTTTVELSAVVIVQPDESRVEGIKVKFNNENSSVLLTLNELNALTFSLDHLNIDIIGLHMYQMFIDKGATTISNTASSFPLPSVDILPKV